MHRLHREIFCFAAAVLLALSVAWAQTTTGSIVGTVTDTSGASVANATVTIANVDTGITNKTITTASGDYVVTPLPVGHYSVTVEAAGFKKSVNGGITLKVQD